MGTHIKRDKGSGIEGGLIHTHVSLSVCLSVSISSPPLSLLIIYFC